ncbi:LutC/YkgG family protein [Gephyromycinifex aptenodytis]|uniref:LutC/YkgG family protein n=1 Tax=Gephyromycinifex aptenodytis TaxID=2716227 RepID=UPI001447FC42|nr:lactate utilization protein C [Gephyromycinifex aptenodytis]
MNAREEILTRIRTALQDVPEVAPEVDVPVEWEYHRATRTEGVLDLFVERVEDYKAAVVRANSGEVPGRIVEALNAHDVHSVVLPAGLDPTWRAALEASEIEVRDDTPLDRAQLDTTDAVVTAACVGAAETGTIFLDHRPDQGRRALTLVPDMHVCVIRADQVVSDVPEAITRVAPSVRENQLPVTMISGGSATSDIELSRVEGVHGPRTLHVVLVQD